jgi:mono/diheme cytochrome c family protein
MKKDFPFAIFLFLFISFHLPAQTGDNETFKSVCSSCHTIGKGRLVGPDLSGIYKIRTNEWLISFIRSSQKMVKSGDTAAVNIFNEFNKIPMPDNNLSDEQILGVIDFIKQKEGSPAAQKTNQVPMDTSAAKNDSLKTASGEAPATSDTTKPDANAVQRGKDMFNGKIQLANGGYSCISCHNLNDQSVLGGGKLARDLTTAFTRLGPQGIRGILTNPPFPAMKTAIKGGLTEKEITDLTALLKSVNDLNAFYRQPSGGLIFFTLGLVCAMFLIVHTYIFYDNRNIPEKIPGTE